MSTPRRITSTTGTIPQSTSITGSVTTQSGNTSAVVYTGSIDLSLYITDGNSGGAMGYVYLVCAEATDKISRITGTSQLDSTTWVIFTDGDVSNATSAVFSLITTPLYGYSFVVDSGTATIDGVSFLTGEGNSEPAPDYADGLNIGNTIKPVYVDAGSGDVLITNESIGAPATA